MAQKRNRRSGKPEDRWTKKVRHPDGRSERVPSARHGKGLRWLARYLDERGEERGKSFALKADAQKFLDAQTAALQAGTHVSPRDSRYTVTAWCEKWIEAYGGNRETTIRQAKTHLKHILAEFGSMELSAVRPTDVKKWIARLQGQGFAASYIYALHARLSQVFSDAVHDGVLGRNPCSRRTSPPGGKAKVYVATTEQIWSLHDAMPEHLRVAVLLGAFAGLRIAEVSGLRVADVDFMRGVVFPHVQWPDKPLKTPGSETPIPVPPELTLLLSASVQRYPSDRMVTNGPGTDGCGPWIIERAFREAKMHVSGLPEEFCFHDLRHYLASLLIHERQDVKIVQARLRHASARTTLDVYGHLWPDADEATRSVIGSVIAERMSPVERTAD